MFLSGLPLPVSVDLARCQGWCSVVRGYWDVDLQRSRCVGVLRCEFVWAWDGYAEHLDHS